MQAEGKHIRTIEIISGLLLLLSTISILLSFLLNFDYTLPHASFEDDIDFITDSISRQKLSALSWIITGVLFLIYLPFYLSVFYSFQKGMHLLNGFCILLLAYTAFKTGLTQFEIVRLVGNEATGNPFISIETEKILRFIRETSIYLKLCISAFGAFTMVFSISRFENVKFPFFASTIAFISGPVILSFTWINSDHILLTAASAAACTGLLIIGSMLVNKGMEKSRM